MKAQHRKELQTNVLADRLGRLIQSAKSGPSRTSIVIWSLVLLAIAVLIGWLGYDYYAKKENSAETRELEEATTREAYKKIADAHPNTPAGRMALMQYARMSLRDGLDHLYAGMSDERATAKEDIKIAGNSFEKLAKDFKDTPTLAQEAFLNAAKARESLGDFDGAASLYRKAVQTDKDSYLGKQAESRASDLDDSGKRKEIEAFYEAMDKFADYKPQGPQEPKTPSSTP